MVKTWCEIWATVDQHYRDVPFWETRWKEIYAEDKRDCLKHRTQSIIELDRNIQDTVDDLGEDVGKRIWAESLLKNEGENIND